MALRICLVTPFAWSQPHDVNEHVAGVADALRDRGHSVTRARSRRTAPPTSPPGGARCATALEAPLIALGPAVPISRRSRIGLPVGVRANLVARARPGARSTSSTASSPGLPSLSYLALRDARALTVASFFSPERLGYPPGKAQRERLLARTDALVAASPEAAHAAAQRFPGEYRIVEEGVDPELFRPADEAEPRRPRVAARRATARAERSCARCASYPTGSSSSCGRSRWRGGRRSRRSCAAGRACAQPATGEAAPRSSTRPRSSSPRSTASPASRSRRPPRARRSPRRRACTSSPSSRPRRSRGWPRTSRCARELSQEARRSVEGKTFADVAAELEELYTSLGRRRKGPCNSL